MMFQLMIVLYFYVLSISNNFVCNAQNAQNKPTKPVYEWETATGPWKSLFEAVRDDNIQKVERLIKVRGVDVNIEGHEFITPLHIAALYGRMEVADFLIRNGAKVDTGERRRKTPLHLAVRYGHENVAELLIKNGAKVDAKNNSQWTPLHIAAYNGYRKIAKLLLQNGAAVDAEEVYEWTPLHFAAHNGHENVAKILIKNGAKVDAEQAENFTPLHLATRNEKKQMVKLLLDAGASIDVKTDGGKTALNIAVEKNYEKIIKMLKTATASQACKRYENLPIERILNGTRADSKEFPWVAALGYVNDADEISFECAGTIISEFFVLTAAHCVKPSRLPVVVRVGTINLTERKRAFSYSIREVIRHSNYSIITKKNDIALVRLRKEIEFVSDVLPACLQTNVRDEHPDVKLIVTGWGITSTETNQRSNELLKAYVKTMPLAECDDKMSLYNWIVNRPEFRDGINQSQYCTYDPDGLSDSCQGDSGGPLQFFPETNSTIATVIGIISFGVSCGADLPSFYTRVAYYLDWIVPIVWP